MSESTRSFVPRNAVITISQPWAEIIARGEKWVENRSTGYPWTSAHGRRILIHAGKGEQFMKNKVSREHGLSLGAIIATAKLGAVIKLADLRAATRVAVKSVEKLGLSVDDVLKHKYTTGPWLLILQEVRRIPSPIPAKGSQGLWYYEGDIPE